MSRERKQVVRPFDDAFDEIWSVLQSTVLKTQTARYLPGDYQLAEGVLSAVPDETLEVDVDLDLEALDEAANGVGLALADFRLSVRTYSKFMNLSNVVFSELASDLDNGSFVVPINNHAREDIDPLRAVVTGFDVQVVLTLDRQRSVAAGSLAPSLRHSILSEVRFGFSSSSGEGTGLNYHRLNDEVRAVEGVPREATIFIKRIESPAAVNRLSDVMAIYVDSQLLDRMMARRRTGAGKLHIAQLGIAILSDVVLRSSLDLNRRILENGSAPTLESLKKTVTGKLIEMVSKKGQPVGRRYESEQLFEELIERPEKMLTRVQALYGSRGNALDSFETEGDPS